MVFVQKSNFFFAAYFRELVSEKMVSILRTEKNDVKGKKLKFFKGPKNKLFLRGSVHGFCPKIELILIAFFFTEIMPEKVVFCYFK